MLIKEGTWENTHTNKKTKNDALECTWRGANWFYVTCPSEQNIIFFKGNKKATM